MEKPFNAPAVGSDRGGGAWAPWGAHSQGRWEKKYQREGPFLVKMICSGTPVMAAGSQAGFVKINNFSHFFEPALRCSWLTLLPVGDVTSV